MSATMSTDARPSPIIYAGIALGVTLVAHVALRELGFAGAGGVRLAATGLLVAAMAVFVGAAVKVARSQDEYHRRVHQEAVVVAFPVALVLVFAVGYLRGEGLLAGRDPRDLWLLLLVPYAVGFIVSSRKYQ